MLQCGHIHGISNIQSILFVSNTIYKNVHILLEFYRSCTDMWVIGVQGKRVSEYFYSTTDRNEFYTANGQVQAYVTIFYSRHGLP